MAEIKTNTNAELEALKKRADLIGIKYSNNISVETLRNKINEVLETKELKNQEKNDKMKFIDKLIKEKMKLVRLQITNLNPAKRDLPGEIFTVANPYIGTVKKFIPYGKAGESYHVPYCIYEQLRDKVYLQINTNSKHQFSGDRWVPEFNLKILPPLTKKELDELKAAQLAGNSID